MNTRTPVIDAHHSFWDHTRFDYDWRLSAAGLIRKPLLPRDLRPLLAPAGVDNTIVIQTLPDLDETRELLRIAQDTPFVAGVIGWVELSDPSIDLILADLRNRPDGRWLVGVRYHVSSEEDPAWLLRPDMQRGLGVVRDAGLSFDFILRAPELPAALATARAFPDMAFVIDQVDKAPNLPSELEVWAGLLEPFRGRANVSGKLCGMITSAGWTDWAPERLRPFIRRALDVFGADRLIFGSDWPVSRLAGDYGVIKQALEDALPPLSPTDWTKFFGGNAIDRYRLELPLLAARDRDDPPHVSS